MLRLPMFCVVGASVMWIGRVLDAAPGLLPWMFASGRLGAVIAIEIAP